MCNRKDEPGYKVIAMHDPSGRRGVWYRANNDGSIELCAGRDGNDAYVRLDDGARVTATLLECIHFILSCGRYGHDLGHDVEETVFVLSGDRPVGGFVATSGPTLEDRVLRYLWTLPEGTTANLSMIWAEVADDDVRPSDIAEAVAALQREGKVMWV
jgi:hypothetical protein